MTPHEPQPDSEDEARLARSVRSEPGVRLGYHSGDGPSPAELEGMTWFGYIGLGIALAALLVSVVLMVAGVVLWTSARF